MATKNPWEEAKTWDERMKLAANQIVTRPEFNYDLNNDPLYNQYRQQYMRQGRLAMMDTMGQAAANNGGYGTSYAQTAGQQAYNSQIQALNDRIPELYQIALDKYQNAGNDLLNRYNMADQMKQMEGVGGYGGGGSVQKTVDRSGNPTFREITQVVNSAISGAAKNFSGAMSAIQQLKDVGAITSAQEEILKRNIQNTKNGVNIKSAPTADELRNMHR